LGSYDIQQSPLVALSAVSITYLDTWNVIAASF
jgi:hypothetical protein